MIEANNGGGSVTQKKSQNVEVEYNGQLYQKLGIYHK